MNNADAIGIRHAYTFTYTNSRQYIHLHKYVYKYVRVYICTTQMLLAYDAQLTAQQKEALLRVRVLFVCTFMYMCYPYCSVLQCNTHCNTL